MGREAGLGPSARRVDHVDPVGRVAEVGRRPGHRRLDIGVRRCAGHRDGGVDKGVAGGEDRTRVADVSRPGRAGAGATRGSRAVLLHDPGPGAAAGVGVEVHDRAVGAGVAAGVPVRAPEPEVDARRVEHGAPLVGHRVLCRVLRCDRGGASGGVLGQRPHDREMASPAAVLTAATGCAAWAGWTGRRIATPSRAPASEAKRDGMWFLKRMREAKPVLPPAYPGCSGYGFGSAGRDAAPAQVDAASAPTRTDQGLSSG